MSNPHKVSIIALINLHFGKEKDVKVKEEYMLRAKIHYFSYTCFRRHVGVQIQTLHLSPCSVLRPESWCVCSLTSPEYEAGSSYCALGIRCLQQPRKTRSMLLKLVSEKQPTVFYNFIYFNCFNLEATCKNLTCEGDYSTVVKKEIPNKLPIIIIRPM